mmetsp:Transcript_68014/g.100931  ORF Transcript_68014/g.100931 Transcript_68014/m.100931 type:complete len:171 (+) Transcript_68014:124-636(+)
MSTQHIRLDATAAAPPQEPHFEPSPKSLPTTITRVYSINDIPTSFLLQLFSDRIFVSVSQLKGKLGTLLSCNMEYSMIDGSKTYNVTTLLGVRDDALLEVYARQISERIMNLGRAEQWGTAEDGSPAGPSILLGIALDKKGRGRDQETFRTIIDLVIDMYTEGLRIASSP